MSREAFGDPPESQEPPQVCPVCGGEWHAEDCEFGKEVARRLKAERDAHKLAHENEQLRRLSSLDAMRAGKLAEDVERYSALHARLFAEKTAAQIKLEGLREALFRLWPAVEKAMAGLVFTADRAGDVAADMSTIRAAIVPEETAPGCKTPAGCRENGCLGWCDEHKPEAAKP